MENLRVRGEKLKAEQALRRREEHQSIVLHSLPIALYTASSSEDHRRLHFTNESVERITGFRPRLPGRPGLLASRITRTIATASCSRSSADRRRGRIRHLEYRWRCADDSDRTSSIRPC